MSQPLTEIGENDPCPCGSGKKFKKCCLKKELLDVLKKISDNYKYKEDEWYPEDDSFLKYIDALLEKNEGLNKAMDEDDEFEENSDEEEDEEDDEEDYPEPVNETVEDDEPLYRRSDKLPKITKEEKKLVDDWWKKYKRMFDTVLIREYLVRFIDKYPHLVEHLEVEHFLLFDMGAAHYEKSIYEVFVALLLRFRKDFFSSYIKRFPYYEADLIYWYVGQGRIEEISQFFYLYKQNTEWNNLNKLAHVVRFLRALNRSDIVLAELANHKKLKNFIIEERINHILSRYLEKPITKESAWLLIDELQSQDVESDPVELNDIFKRLQRLQRPFTRWDENLPRKRSEAGEYYLDITENFTRYLHEKTGLSFDSACYYSECLNKYYKKVVAFELRPVDTFCLDEQSFEEYSSLKDRDIFDFEVDNIVQFNALYYFADYLKTCGNLTGEQKRTFQAFIIESYRSYYAEFEKKGPEMLPFKQFPYNITQ